MKKIRLGSVNEFPLDQPRILRAESVMVIVYRNQNGFYAVENRCSHLGLPLGLSHVEGETVTCPFHGSKFSLCSGENLDWVTSFAGAKLPEWSRRLVAMGKTPTALETFPVSVEGNEVFISL